MKTVTFRILLSAMLLFLLTLCSCNATDSFIGDGTDTDPPQDTEPLTYTEMIRELEDKIIELQQNQYIADAEHQQELKKLQAQLAELKGNAPSDSDSDQDSSQNTETENPPPESETVSKFLYTKDGTNAIITAYEGSESHVVIPDSIDGYTVTAIGSNAFSSSTLKCVIISNGIKKIDWFAFSECSSLISVTIPQSVTSIGYSAFAPQDTSFTIYCHNNSFAHKYAKSYGFSYSLI